MGNCTLKALVEGSAITPDKANEIHASLQALSSTDDKLEALIHSFHLISLFTEPRNGW
jgi:hypothetical protein